MLLENWPKCFLFNETHRIYETERPNVENLPAECQDIFKIQAPILSGIITASSSSQTAI